VADRRGAGPSAAALGNEVSRKSDGKRLAVATVLAILFDALACGALAALLAGAARTATSDEAATWLSVQLEPQTPAGTELAAERPHERPQERPLAVGTAYFDRLANSSVPATVPASAAVGVPAGTELDAAASAEAAAGPSAAQAPTSGSDAGSSPGARTGNGDAGTELDAPIATREDILVRLDEAIKRKLQYPTRARERGIEGRVLLEILVDEAGSLRNCAVETSSGSPMLDTAARRLLADIFPLRASLASPFSALVAVEYRLR
jgi:periplasmic protein TonB